MTSSDYEADAMGLEAMVGTRVQVTIPGYAAPIRQGELRLDRNPDGSLRALTLLGLPGRAVSIGWGAGVLVEPSP